MPTDFTRGNRDLEARIRQMNDPSDLQNMLAEVSVTEVLRGAKPAPGAPSYVDTRLRKIVETPDGRQVTITAHTWTGLDMLEAAVKEGRVTEDLL